jgi:hypothetical protein
VPVNSDVRRLKELFMRIAILLFIAAAMSTHAAESTAQEAPTTGMLYNLSETHSLTYRCDMRQTGQLECDFIQTAVRYKATYADLPATLDKARKAFGSEKPPTAQDCGMFRDMLDIVEGKKQHPKPEAVAEMSTVMRNDLSRLAKVLLEYCKKPTEDSFLNVVREGADKDRRTCKVSSYPFKQTFRLVSDSSIAKTWVAQSRPEGQCGIVQLSRFEPEVVTIGSAKFTHWKYVARKAITNPSGELFPGAKCTGLDERPYTYDWRAADKSMSCDYIEFSPL